MSHSVCPAVDSDGGLLSRATWHRSASLDRSEKGVV